MKRLQPEYQLQCAVVEYLRIAHRGVLFASDVKGSIKLTIPQSVRFKKLQCPDFAQPDLVIFAMRGGFGAMFLEFKSASPYRQDGRLRRSDHIHAQAASIEALRQAGYHADFYWDFAATCASIIEYMSGSSVKSQNRGYRERSTGQ